MFLQSIIDHRSPQITVASIAANCLVFNLVFLPTWLHAGKADPSFLIEILNKTGGAVIEKRGDESYSRVRTKKIQISPPRTKYSKQFKYL